MASEAAPTFGDLLKRYRVAAGLSQEALAERARLSARAISDLERGLKLTPRRDTVALLVQALALSADEGAALEATVARRRGPPVAPAPPAGWTQEDPPHATAAPAALPSGTLTFLLTAIEESSALWARHPAVMQAAIARHDALVDEALARHEGRQVKERGAGDSVLAVFTSPAAAVAAACALQEALLAAPWPPAAHIRVGMGLHTGEAELRGSGYDGLTVTRAARLRALAHGGQVLLSGATAGLVRDALPAGGGLRGLGTHALADRERPEEVYQLLHPALPAEFPPLWSPTAPRHNLPLQPTSFVGREREREEVRDLLGRARLVTLTGTGGVGKTRLALAVAAAAVDTYPDGVWLVEFAALADPALVPQALAAVLGVREEPHRPLLATLIAHLQPQALLLVLDNCEHLIAACAALAAALLGAYSHLRLLATSREALEVAGETLYRVPSLAAPDPDELPDPTQLPRYAAAQLFLARARSRHPEFALSAQNAPAVAQICARLDGLPLAIELAAARVGSLPVEAIAGRLDERFRLLTGGPRTALPRQQTLRATLDWSYDLLGEPEQRLLRQLAVFAGSWTLEAAEAVGAGDGLDGWAVLDVLDQLTNKSLMLLDEMAEEARYRLLETVQQYAHEQLAAGGEAAGTRDRHLAYFLALAEEAAPHLTGAEQGVWLGRLEAEHDNLRAALAWARERQEGELGLRLAGALWRFWYTRGHLSEGRGWLEATLAGAQGSPTARAIALNGAGNLAWAQGAYGRAAALHEEALTLWRALEDKWGIARSLGNLGGVVTDQGEYRRAATLHEEALGLFRELGDTWGSANALGNLGLVALYQGEYGRAATLYEEALRLSRELGDTRGSAVWLDSLGMVVSQQGEHRRAATLYEEALRLFRELGDRRGSANALGNLGRAVLSQGEYGRAAALLEEALLLSRDIGTRELVAAGIEGLAWVAASCGQSRRATRLCGAAEALREVLGAPLPPDEHAGHDQAVQAMHAALGEEAFAAAWAAGRALPLEEAISLALERGEADAPRSGAAEAT